MKAALLIFLFLASCARAPLTDPAKAFRLAEGAPHLRDSYDISSLAVALERTLVAIQAGVNIPAQYVFGERIVGREEYRRALEALRPEMESFERFHAFVSENFEFYEVYGNDEGWGQVFATGYYDPVIQGSLKKTSTHSRPIYKSPPDLVSVDLTAYAELVPQLKDHLRTEQKSKRPIWRGRYLADTKTIVPYYPRAEVEAGLSGMNLELAWMDPIDAFFLEIQGSGLIEFGRGKSIRVGYASQNGYPYVPIGKFLTHMIPIEEMSMQRIRQALNTMSPEQRDQVLFLNPSYVFFQELKGLSLTFSGAEVTPMRTIATDQFFFPKGTLNFLEIELPMFSNEESQAPDGWELKPRWVFDQDTGGAIRGGGRLDLYMGQGPQPERMAGVMKRTGRMWVVAPKQSFLQRLAATNP